MNKGSCWADSISLQTLNGYINCMLIRNDKDRAEYDVFMDSGIKIGIMSFTNDGTNNVYYRSSQDCMNFLTAVASNLNEAAEELTSYAKKKGII